jgi:hypothetical protein
MDSLDDNLAAQSGRLTALALRPGALPSAQPEYHALVRRFLSDAEFQRATESFLSGLGLRVLGVSESYGLVLGSEADSPFAVRRDDYRKTLSATDRLIQGVVHLAIGAWCFPRAEDLNESELVVAPRLTVEQLVEHVAQLCEECRRQDSGEESSPEEELRTAWQAILALGKYSDSAGGRESFATLAGKVQHAFNFLTEQGLLKRDDRDNRPGWLARPAFRLHVRELAGHRAWEIINHAARRAQQHGPAA